MSWLYDNIQKPFLFLSFSWVEDARLFSWVSQNPLSTLIITLYRQYCLKVLVRTVNSVLCCHPFTVVLDTLVLWLVVSQTFQKEEILNFFNLGFCEVNWNHWFLKTIKGDYDILKRKGVEMEVRWRNRVPLLRYLLQDNRVSTKVLMYM